ncbi:MAG: methyltransferase domain-containing protein [Methylomonas sp.]|jgi:ubiquinone/menaquinone biosynthesis C-methylase UbiE|uniref:class I SAM-dependent methyltransferase n=1 Tax=Methylomonas sp. TaxID=418 RepID=UPI0025EDF918|nr:methyltransferase domain-containing protein [Methylomonas sp.]MCK9606015.1 methyltransferase domain-containing protein [Methylomonas sp.]
MTPIQNPSQKTRDEIAKAYASDPWWYDLRGFLILTFAYRSTLWEQVDFFGKNIAKEHLEVAIGTGTLFDIILKWRKFKRMPPAHIIGVDYAESMLNGAKQRFSKHPEIELNHADVANLPYPDDFFDSANIANAVHCFPDLNSGLIEVLRTLKPGGRLAANVLLYPRGSKISQWIAQKINNWGIRKGILYTPYEADDIKKRLIDTGFEIVSEKISGNTYNVLAQKMLA